MISPYPSFERVRPARVPPPPRLDPDQTEAERALALANAYTSSVKHYYKVSRALEGHTVETLKETKYHALLVNVQSIFIDEKIAPSAWCAFSCEAWIHSSCGSRIPPVRWVYAKKRLSERLDWFFSFAQRYLGGKTIVSPAHKELVARHRKMYRALLALGDSLEVSEESVVIVVNEHLPRRMYDRLVREAGEQVEEIEYDMGRELQRGTFLW